MYVINDILNRVSIMTNKTEVVVWIIANGQLQVSHKFR